MQKEAAHHREREIAHVLFMDVVGYSLLPLDAQSIVLAELQDIVRNLPEFQQAQSAGDLLRVPTGDGMALVFFRDPSLPVHCAVQIARSTRTHPRLKLRMGIHSGPVQRVDDINNNQNVTGGGINYAHRIMDCGDAGHILLSQIVVDLLRQIGTWDDVLHDLGECVIKHGERIRVFNLYTVEVGNRQVPERLLPHLRASESSGRAGQAGPGRKVMIAYRRKATPDNEVLELLEERLQDQGHRVFIDRHLSIGVEWVKEIERQVRTSDALIPLISDSSMDSEMLEYEIQTAFRSAQEQGGSPRILPIRVAYEGPLSPTLSVILDPLEYSLWESHDDDDRVVTEVLAALGSQGTEELYRPEKLEAVGGAVPLDSHFYVVRPADKEFQGALERHDSIVLVKGARQMGKTSLLARGLQSARQSGLQVVFTDFQKLTRDHLSTSAAFFQAVAMSIADQLELDVAIDDIWDSRRGPNTNFERFLRRHVLANTSQGIVWAMDEVDRLFSPDVTFATEVFGLFRSWHNERSLDPSGPWNRLTLAISYATEAHLFISDINQSPFNVGTRLALQEFTYDQVSDLNDRYGRPLLSSSDLTRFYRLLGGHPYLTRRGLNELAAHGMDVAALEAQAAMEDGPFGDHLRRLLVSIAHEPELTEAMRSVLRGSGCPTPDLFYRLRSAGVVAGEASSEASSRCLLYTVYLERHLLS